MPNWIPRQSIQEQLSDEIAKQEAIRFVQASQRSVTPAWTPLLPEPVRNIPNVGTLPEKSRATPVIDPTISNKFQDFTPIQQEIANYMPAEYRSPNLRSQIDTSSVSRVPSVQGVTEPSVKASPVNKTDVKPATPFWQRALQVFAAPFNWIDEYLIKPTLSVAATSVGAVANVERKPGEEYFDWKRRSWNEWEAPGVDINVPWSDNPWRVDIKGVAEFAPWLLIPGAGQVGSAVSGLGKVGFKATMKALGGAVAKGEIKDASRIATGAAISYSPWGLAEKPAGVAIKSGFRVIGNVSAKVSTAVGEKLFGKYVPPPTPPAVEKVSTYFEQTVMPGWRKYQKALPELRAKQEAKVLEVNARWKRGEIPVEQYHREMDIARTGGIKEQFAFTPEALAKRKSEDIAGVKSKIASGEYTAAVGKAQLTKIEKSPSYTPVTITPVEVKQMVNMMDDAFQYGLVEAKHKDAFLNLMLGELKEMPQKGDLLAWKSVLGERFAKAVGSLGNPSRANQVVDALSIPKSLVSMADMSGFGRQGLFFLLLHPTKIPTWFVKTGKSFLSEKLTLEADDALRARPSKLVEDGGVPIASIFQKHGGYFRPIKEAPLALREEAYPAMAEGIPFLRRSGRSFNQGLNEMGVDTFEAGYYAMKGQGATKEQIDLWAQFINLASGRGALPKGLDKYAPALNLAFFSPRLQAATLELPVQIGRMFTSGNPYMRKEAGKALVVFAGGGATLLGLLNATKVAKVEGDARSGDFGKIRFQIGKDEKGNPKYGETRYDIWRGYIQYARFAAQMLTGQRKSAFGILSNAQRGEIAARFIQSKTSPIAGLIADIWRGENYQGEPLFNDTAGFSKIARERFLPLAVQDVIDAMEMNGVNGALIGAPAMLGIGVLTYVHDYVRAKNRIAKENGYESWSAIDPKTQLQIQRNSPELQAAEITYDRQSMGTAWGDWHLAGKAVEEVFSENVSNAVAQFKETGDGVLFRKKIGKAYDERKGGYNARTKEERFTDIVDRLNTQDPVQAMVTLGPEQMAIKTYNDALYGDDMYDEFNDYRFDESEIRKQQVRSYLGDKMYKYVEDYIGEKTADLPPEFQELKAAKIALRPYWQVDDNVERLFGKRFAESSKGQAMISKKKKQMRATSPDIAKYYQLFYANN